MKKLFFTLVTICIIVIGVVGSFMIQYNKKQDNIKKYLEECKVNLSKEDNYIIVNTVYTNYSEYQYIDSVVGGDMYSEDAVEDSNNFMLTTWTTEDGTTYAINDGFWIEYPKEFNEIALYARELDIDLWLNSISRIYRSSLEKLNLGYQEPSDVSMYNFEVSTDTAKGILSSKLNAIYKALISEYKSKDATKYSELITEYENYIEENEIGYNFKSVTGKIGVYKNKIVLFSIDLVGVDNEVHYSKIVGFDTFDKRVKPNFEEENIIKLSDYSYMTFTDK